MKNYKRILHCTIKYLELVIRLGYSREDVKELLSAAEDIIGGKPEDVSMGQAINNFIQNKDSVCVKGDNVQCEQNLEPFYKDLGLHPRPITQY